MRIAVNTRLLIKNKLEGIGGFIHETLKLITVQHPEHEFYFLFDRDYDEDFIFSDNITPLIIGPQARHPFLYYIWFESAIPVVLKKLKIDLFLSPDGYLSLRSKVPSINVIHDLNFEHQPSDYPFFERKYYQYFFPRYARKASRIATVSEFSKSDIIEKYNIDRNKISVVYNAAKGIFKPLAEADQTQTRNKYSDGHPYFIYVGSIQARKNLTTLIKAFDQFKEESSLDTKLLLVGSIKWMPGDLKAALRNSAFMNDIIFTGRIDDLELHKLIASSKALMLISKLEGFGVPILEAYFCDVPVITSNRTSMPEVAGKGSLLVDPYHTQSVTEAMLQIHQNEELRNELIAHARLHREKFSWQLTADKLWDCIELELKK